MQCLSVKLPGWTPEPGDEDYETQAEHCFVTGISTQGPDEFDLPSLHPVKHGIADTMIDNCGQEEYGLVCLCASWVTICRAKLTFSQQAPHESAALPMHPNCFEMFKILNMRQFGKIEIDGLWVLREVCTVGSAFQNRVANETRSRETTDQGSFAQYKTRVDFDFAAGSESFRTTQI